MTDFYKMVPVDTWEKIDDLLVEAYDVQVRYSEDKLEMANEAIENMKSKLDEIHLLWAETNKSEQATRVSGKFVKISERPHLIIAEDE